MCTRRAAFRIKADSAAAFTRIAEGQFPTPPCAQQGCCHGDAFITPELSETVIN